MRNAHSEFQAPANALQLARRGRKERLGPGWVFPDRLQNSSLLWDANLRSLDHHGIAMIDFDDPGRSRLRIRRLRRGRRRAARAA